MIITQTSFIFALLLTKAIRKTNKIMKELKLTPSLGKMMQVMQIGEAVKVLATNCKESAVRIAATRLKKSKGFCYRVNAVEGYCVITRIA